MSARERWTSTPVELSAASLFSICSPPPVLSCCSVSEDSGDNEDEDAPVQAVDTYLRGMKKKSVGGNKSGKNGKDLEIE